MTGTFAASHTPTVVAVSVTAAALAFWVYCLYDFTRTDEAEVRTFSRGVWILLLVFTSLFGSLLWWFYGRPRPPA